MLVVGVERFRFRVNAYVDLHAWLASAARSATPLPEELAPALAGYERALADDEEDALLVDTTRALAACTNDACASRALAGTRMGPAFDSVLPAYVARHWTERATIARNAVERARAATRPEADAIVLRLTRDLDVRWPDDGVPVDVVVDAPPPGRKARLPYAIGARGTCFFSERDDPPDDVDAQILDCVLSRALFAVDAGVRDGLERACEPRCADRAWRLLVGYAVTATVDGFRRSHRSAARHATDAEMRAAYAWLRTAWPPRSPEERASFGGRLLRAMREEHSP